MRALAAAAALLAVGCAGVGTQRVYSVEVLTNYSPSTFGAFAAAGPAVEFRGALPGGATPEQTAAALSLPGWWPQTPFRAVPEGAESQRLVIAFGAAGDAGALCQPGASPATTPGRLEAAAAYCLGSRVASLGRLSAEGDLAPGDPAFTAAMRSLLGDIAPTREPRLNEDGEYCVFPPC
jgi:hypothetical protein